MGLSPAVGKIVWTFIVLHSTEPFIINTPISLIGLKKNIDIKKKVQCLVIKVGLYTIFHLGALQRLVLRCHLLRCFTTTLCISWWKGLAVKHRKTYGMYGSYTYMCTGGCWLSDILFYNSEKSKQWEPVSVSYPSGITLKGSLEQLSVIIRKRERGVSRLC